MAQSLNVEIVSDNDDDRFCEGEFENFYFHADVSGGEGAYTYMWTNSWNEDTTYQDWANFIRVGEAGTVKVRVTDSSFPPKIKEKEFDIKEVSLLVDFVFTNDGSCAETPIQFTSAVSGGGPNYTYWWDFGDGSNSDEKNPKHEFVAPGCNGEETFNVRLTVTDENGCVAQVQKVIRVKRKPHLYFDDTANPWNPFKHCHNVGESPVFDVELANRSSPTSCISSYDVDWGDGDSQNDVSFPLKHTYDEVGAFQIKVTAHNSGSCDLEWTRIVYNQSTPAAGLASDGGKEGCAPVTFSFKLENYENNSIGTTYTWDFGDGSERIVWDQESITDDNISHEYTRSSCAMNEWGWIPGDYTTVVTVNNGCGSVSATVNGVRVWAAPGAAIKEGGIDTICVDEPIQLVNNTTVGYYGTDCSELAEYHWDFGDLNFSEARLMPPHSWSEPGTYFVELTSTNICGTTTDDYPIVVVEPPTADVEFDETEGCAPFTPKIENTSSGDGAKYFWTVSPDTGYSYLSGTNKNSFEPEFNFTLSGEYQVTQFVSNACSKTESVVTAIEVYARPGGVIKGVEDACIEDPTLYPSVVAYDNGTPITSFRWNFRNGTPSSSTSELPGEVRFPTVGEHYVELVLENMCGTKSLGDTLEVFDSPGIVVENPVTLCGSDPLQISGTQVSRAVSYHWLTLGDGYFDVDTLLNPTYYPGGEDLANLGNELLFVAEGEFPCTNDTAVVEVIIQKAPSVVVDEDVFICEGSPYIMKEASAENYGNIRWHTSGDGSFSDPEMLLPTYTPGNNDLAGGHVALWLTADAILPCAEDAADTVHITYARNPVIDAGEDQDICERGQVTFSATDRDVTSVTWKVEDEAGSFDNPAELETVFTLDPGFTGDEVTISILAMGGYGCDPTHDTVILSVVPLPVVKAGADAEICADGTYVLTGASLEEYSAFHWTTSGDGTFDNHSILGPEYRPGPEDKDNGVVNLSLVAEGNSVCPEVSDDVVLTVQALPRAFAGEDQLVCKWSSFLTTGEQEHGSSWQWSSLGTGRFEDGSELATTYTPSESDLDQGSVALVLTVDPNLPCSLADHDTVRLTFVDPPEIFAGNDTIIGEGDIFVAGSAEAPNIDQVNWTTLGDGSFTNDRIIRTSYQPGASDLENQGVYLVVRGTFSTVCVGESLDTVFVQITPKPKAEAGDDADICEGSAFTVRTAGAEEYSEIFWTSGGTGILTGEGSLTPTYTPSPGDIENRSVVLTLNARGKPPIEDYLTSDSMVIHIIHNASIDLPAVDTACENSLYQISESFSMDVNEFTWSTSGTGFFNGTREAKPEYTFSEDDRSSDSIFFFVEVSSMLPCVHVDRDTAMIRIYHEPEPLFDMSDGEGCAPLVVSFNNASTGEDLQFRWDFGNGLESEYEYPGEVVFEQGRIADTTYTVTLEASNRCNTLSSSKEVLVKPIPISDFGMNVAWGCSPLEVYFVNSTTGLPDSYQWKWGDGTEETGEGFLQSHVFLTGDLDSSYTITLVAENECGIDSIQKNVQVFPNTVDAFFETDTVFGCAPLTVSFTNYSRGVLGDEPFLNWSWNFGDGNSITDTVNPVHVFTEPGDYTVTLYVNDTCSHDAFTTDIHVMGAPRTEFITDKERYCENDTVFVSPVDLDIDNVASIIWDFGDTHIKSGFTAEHAYDTSGTFTITASAKDIVNGCTSRFSQDVSIITAPIAAFSIPENDGCEELDITFSNETEGGTYFGWDYGDGNKSVEEQGQHLFKEPGTFNVSLRAINDQGCFDSVSHTLLVNPKPHASFETSSDLSCISPVDVRFTNTTEGADGYQWSFGNGSRSKDTNPLVSYTDYGNYHISLIATNLYACTDTSELIYHVYHNPVAEFTVDSAIGCDPFEVSFSNLSEYGTSYRWEFDKQGSSSEEEPVFTFEGEGIYTVSLVATGLGGCADSITREEYIVTNPSPVSDFTYTRVNEIDTVQFYNYSSGAISYVWDFGDGFTSETADPWHRYLYYGNYLVGLTSINEYNCTHTKYDSINFELFKGLYLPNAFSPDNISEDVREFKAVGIGLVRYHLQVFDTWGNLLWETSKLERGVPAEGWDGTFKGQALGPDVYVWHLREAIFKDGSSYEGERYGTVTLIK